MRRRRCCRPPASGCTASTTSSCAAASSRRCRSTTGTSTCGDHARAASRAGAETALAEVARVLKPGGRVIIVDMLPHDRESYRQQMGHVWLGFPGTRDGATAPSTRHSVDIRIVPLPADPVAGDRDCSSQRRRAVMQGRGTDGKRRARMATVTEKMHPFAAAKAAGREPFKVEGPRRSPNSAARKSASPSRKCPA